MFDAIVQAIQHLVGGLNVWITQTLHGNAIVGGAVTASIVGSLFFALRKMPLKLWVLVKRYLFFTYSIEYNPLENQGMISDIAERFEYEIQKHVSQKRASARLSTRKNRIVETLSDGGFYYRYKQVWMFISRTRSSSEPGKVAVTSTGKNTQPIITLTFATLRFHRKQITEMLSEAAKEYVSNGVFQVLAPNWSGSPATVTRNRNFLSIPNLAIDASVKEKINSALDNFIAQRVANVNGEPLQKLVFLFYGEPGTGKSALAEYVAFYLKTSLFCINGRSSASRGTIILSDAVSAARDNIEDGDSPVLLCDDFDTIWTGIVKREPKPKTETNPYPELAPSGSGELGLMLTDLQSPVEIRDAVIIFTTNHLETIDPAVYRPGRVSLMIEIGRMQPKSVMEYYEMSYGSKWPEHVPIERAFRACDVSEFYNTNQNNPQGFVAAITSSDTATDEAFQSKETADN